jgi:hypothetical protein
VGNVRWSLFRAASGYYLRHRSLSVETTRFLLSLDVVIVAHHTGHSVARGFACRDRSFGRSRSSSAKGSYLSLSVTPRSQSVTNGRCRSQRTCDHLGTLHGGTSKEVPLGSWGVPECASDDLPENVPSPEPPLERLEHVSPPIVHRPVAVRTYHRSFCRHRS